VLIHNHLLKIKQRDTGASHGLFSHQDSLLVFCCSNKHGCNYSGDYIVLYVYSGFTFDQSPEIGYRNQQLVSELCPEGAYSS
jgi:hypothetical protein